MRRLKTPHGFISAERIAEGVPINPKLPPAFEDTANEERPASHRKFWHVPFIVTETVERLDAYYAERADKWADEGREHWTKARPEWLSAWPSGTRYEVRCLDGGAWDRATSWGMFPSLEAALSCAHGGPRWRGESHRGEEQSAPRLHQVNGAIEA
jgi:hypothetical protein